MNLKILTLLTGICIFGQTTNSSAMNLIPTEESALNINQNENLDEALLCACVKKYDLEKIKLLIEKGANVNAEDKSGFTPLACNYQMSEDIEIAKLLITNGASVTTKFCSNNTLLRETFLSGKNPEAFRKLYVENGANLFVEDDVDQTSPWECFYSKKDRKHFIKSLFPWKPESKSSNHRSFLKLVVSEFAKRMTNSIDSATLNATWAPDLIIHERLYNSWDLEHGLMPEKELLSDAKNKFNLEETEGKAVISLVQKFIKLLYTTPKNFLTDLFILKKNTLGFDNKELALCAKLFTYKSPLINLLSQYNQNWPKNETYFFKNIKNIIPKPIGKKTKKQQPYEDIKIFFQS